MSGVFFAMLRIVALAIFFSKYYLPCFLHLMRTNEAPLSARDKTDLPHWRQPAIRRYLFTFHSKTIRNAPGVPRISFRAFPRAKTATPGLPEAPLSRKRA